VRCWWVMGPSGDERSCRVLSLLLGVTLGGCSSAKGGDALEAHSARDPSSAAPLPGQACAPDPSDLRSSCADGQVCLPSPGGYCTSFCGATGEACVAGSTCVSNIRAGEICARSCESDADCRGGEGYSCDLTRRACVMPTWLSPPFSSCNEEAQPLGGFTSPAILSNASFGVYQTEPAAALTSTGDLVVVYTNNGNVLEPSSLGVTRVPRGRKPQVGRIIPTQKKIHFDPWMAKSKDGSIHLVWLGHNGNGVDREPEIGYARTVDGGETWSTPVSVHDPHDCKSDTRYCLDRPAIAIGPVPEPAWRRSDSRLLQCSVGPSDAFNRQWGRCVDTVHDRTRQRSWRRKDRC
jgi:hypothetical protein